MPSYPAAVVAGNTETSQRVVDVVFGALAKALPGHDPRRELRHHEQRGAWRGDGVGASLDLLRNHRRRLRRGAG